MRSKPLVIVLTLPSDTVVLSLRKATVMSTDMNGQTFWIEMILLMVEIMRLDMISLQMKSVRIPLPYRRNLELLELLTIHTLIQTTVSGASTQNKMTELAAIMRYDTRFIFDQIGNLCFQTHLNLECTV